MRSLSESSLGKKAGLGPSCGNWGMLCDPHGVLSHAGPCRGLCWRQGEQS